MSPNPKPLSGPRRRENLVIEAMRRHEATNSFWRVDEFAAEVDMPKTTLHAVLLRLQAAGRVVYRRRQYFTAEYAAKFPELLGSAA